MSRGPWVGACGDRPLKILRQQLKRMGLQESYDPFLPPRKIPKTMLYMDTSTPGENYPPGKHANEAMRSLRFDQHIAALERKRAYDQKF